MDYFYYIVAYRSSDANAIITNNLDDTPINKKTVFTDWHEPARLWPGLGIIFSSLLKKKADVLGIPDAVKNFVFLTPDDFSLLHSELEKLSDNVFHNSHVNVSCRREHSRVLHELESKVVSNVGELDFYFCWI